MRLLKSLLLSVLFVSSTYAGTNNLTLTWTNNANNADGTKIERKPGLCSSANTFVQIDTVGVNVTTYDDTGLSSGVTYSYRVRAFNTVGNSGYSNCASGTTTIPPQPPPAPSNLNVISQAY